MKIKYLSVLGLAMVLLLGACGKKDADIQKAAQDKLNSENISGATVTVKDGVATLTGQVADITVKNRAESAVKVDGVKSVTNNLTLKPLPTPPPVADDKMIEGTINESLKKKNITGVTVSVSNGEVTLTGTVSKDKLAEVMAAASEAKPKKVNNQLTVK